LRLGSSMLSATSSHLAECPDIGPECAGPNPPAPFFHHVDLFTSDVVVDASYGITSYLAAELRLALRVVDLTPSYTEQDGTPKQVPNDPHHHDVTLFGPTDPWIVMRFGATAGKLVAQSRIGVSVPIGKTQPNPYELGLRGISHEHTQFGTGTFVPIVGVGLSYSIDPVTIDASAVGLFNIYENDKGFRAPLRFYPSVRVTFDLLDGKLKPNVAAELPYEGAERWNGTANSEGEGGWRLDLLAGGGVTWIFADPWQADLGLRARIASWHGGAVFDYLGVVQFGLSTHFDIVGAESESQEHDHGHE